MEPEMDTKIQIIFCSLKMTPFGGSILKSIRFLFPNLIFYNKTCGHPVWRAIEKELVSGSHFGTILN